MFNHRTRQFLVIGVSLLIIAVALLACGQSSSNDGVPVSTSSGTTPTSAPAAQHFKVGQQVKVRGTWIVIVNTARTSQGSQYLKPKSGDVYLVLNITVKNISSQEQNISSALNFSLQDNTGQKYDETIDPDAGATLDGKVEAGSPLRGAIVYEVPASMHQFTLTFQADITSAGQTIWDITV